MSARNGRVLVLIDVDGVVRPLGAVSGSVRHDIHVPADDLPPTSFIKTDDDGTARLSVNLNPDLHGSWITALRTRADVRLASTWEGAFNVHLAPLLGIDPLPLGISHGLVRPKFGMRDPLAWKTHTITELYDDGRPLVFIDDDATHLIPHIHSDADRAYAAKHGFELEADRPWRDGPTLVIAPDPSVGLTAQDMARVDSFVAEHSA